MKTHKPIQPHRNQQLPLVMLLALSLVTIAMGIGLLVAQRQPNNAQARPAAAGRSLSHAPDFKLTSVEGATIRLDDLRGKVVLLNFWATWCPPCKAEMPDLDALYRDYGAGHDFMVLGIDVEESRADVEAFARRQKIGFPLLLDGDGRVSDALYAVRSLPTSLIIDRQGFIRDAWTGQITQKAMLTRLKEVW